MSKEDKSRTIFYGWFVVAACFAVALTLGETFWSFGVFFKPLEAEFGWSRSLISSSYTAFLIGYAISVVAAGRLADRYSPRPILFATAVLAGLGISLCSETQSINQLRLFLFITGIELGNLFDSTHNELFSRRFLVICSNTLKAELYLKLKLLLL